MTSERGLWKTTRTHLAPFGKLTRLESPIDPGLPDVLYVLRRRPTEWAITGLLELKELDRWPARAATPIRVPSLTREQVEWHRAWNLAGGRVFTLLQVGRDYLLLHPRVLWMVYERRLIRTHLSGMATLTWTAGAWPLAPLLDVLAGVRSYPDV